MSESVGQGSGEFDEVARRRLLEQVGVWRNQLINLARSNRLLYFHHTRTSTLEILGGPDTLASVVSRLLAGRPLRLYSPPDEQADQAHELDPDAMAVEGIANPSHPAAFEIDPDPDELVTSKNTARELRNTLQTLERRSTQEFIDKGIWILYLAIGLLHWKDPDFPEEYDRRSQVAPATYRGSIRWTNQSVIDWAGGTRFNALLMPIPSDSP